MNDIARLKFKIPLLKWPERDVNRRKTFYNGRRFSGQVLTKEGT